MARTDVSLLSMAKAALENGSSIDDDDDAIDQNTVVDNDVQDEEEVVQPVKQAQTATPQKTTVVRDFLKSKFNADLSDEISDEDLAPRLADVLVQHRQMQDELESLRQYASASQRQQQAQPEPKKSESPAKPKWESLNYDADWEKAAEFDSDTRQWLPKPKFGAWGIEAANNLNNYTRTQTDRARRLTANPFEVVRESGLDDYLEGFRQQIIDEFRGQQEQTMRQYAGATQLDKDRSEMEQFFISNKSEYFKTDKDGNVLTDLNGNAVLTKRGEVYRGAVMEARDELGISDPKSVHRYALRLAGTVQTQAAPVAEPAKKTAKERNSDQKKKFLERGKDATTRLANRTGSVQSARERGEAQNPGLSFREMVLQDPENEDVLGSDFQG